MLPLHVRTWHGARLMLGLSIGLLVTTLSAQTSPAADPIVLDSDSAALLLARQYVAGGADSRAALEEALDRMGWSVRDAKGALLKAPRSGDTGLALRDYEIEELLWKPSEQPSIRLISYAQALAIPLEGADPEELAQDLIETLRKSAASDQPQQRFWARFIIALGRVSPANYDLAASSPPAVMQPTPAQMKGLEKLAMTDPMALIKVMQPKPVWPKDDPVLAPSPRPKHPLEGGRPGSAERDRLRLEELSDQISALTEDLTQSDEARQKAAGEKLQKLSAEMGEITQRQASASLQQTADGMAKMNRATNDDEEDDEEEDNDDGPRFTAEWRDQPLSFLQISLLTRVIAADLRQIAARHAPARGHAATRWLPPLPLAAIGVAQAAPAPAPSFGDQFTGAIGDVWATASGAYTGAVLEHYMPENKFSKGMSVANTIIAWYKTIMTVVRQKITVKVDDVPLVRTKTRSPGQQRTARATVEIDFPKSDALKAIRAAGNLTTLDLQMPDGGPVSGAKVVWRLPEGSYNGKYQNAKGGWDYRPDLAIVQFAEGAGYETTTNDNGETSITIEGAAQKKNLPNTVRPYPRRAAIAVEVTIKVGNLTQDLNDAISLAMGGPVSGSLTFIADMCLRTSFLFGASTPFEVTDWKEPAWQGEFEITIKGAGSKSQDGEKGGPPVEYTWSMDHYMIGRLHTPDWAEDGEAERDYKNDARHKLEVDGESRHFRLKDSSSAKSKKSHNRYRADGPLQIPPPSGSPLASYSRAEPTGDAELMFTGGKMVLQLDPFFIAECLVTRSEQNGGRTANRSGAETLSLLGGISPDSFTIIEANDGSADFVEGTKTFDQLYKGNLPFVPAFDVVVTVKYRLWKNEPPPKNKPR